MSKIVFVDLAEHPNFSELNNGIAFVKDGGFMVSAAPVDDDVADAYASIPGMTAKTEDAIKAEIDLAAAEAAAAADAKAAALAEAAKAAAAQEIADKKAGKAAAPETPPAG